MENVEGLKILQLSKFYPPVWGGIESVTFEITEGLNKAGINCNVLVANTKFKNEVTIFSKGYTVFRAANLGRIFSTSIAPSLLKKLSELKDEYNIIHIHFPDPLTALSIIVCNPKAKIVVHWHSDVIKQTFLLKFFLPLQNSVLRRADLIIGTSPKYINESIQLRNFLYKCVPIPLGSRVVKENDSDEVAKFSERYKSRTILFALGRLVYYKGFEHLIDAAGLLPDHYIVLIGGTGPMYTLLANKIKHKGLSNKVVLLGKINNEELSDYFKACRIFCFPSTHASEAFGVSQIEAMSFGKPVIATKIPKSGVSWVNQDGVSGINVPVSNPGKLAEAIIQIDTNPILYQRLSEGALKRYKELFTPEKMVESVINEYRKLINPIPVINRPLNKFPKVSIITVLLDNKKYIKDAIMSVLNQTYPNIEYIIIDGGSKDGSVEIIKSYKDNIDYFVSEKDNGMYDALNKGLLRATGDIVGILNSDDIFENNLVIQKVIDVFNSENCDGVYGDLHYIDHSIKKKIVRIWRAGKYNSVRFYNGWMPPHPTFYVRKEVYNQFGLFNTTLKFAADYELMLRFILKHKIKLGYLPEFMIKMRVGGASNRNLQNRIKANLEDRKAWKIVGIKPGIFTLILKPVLKVFQYKFFFGSHGINS